MGRTSLPVIGRNIPAYAGKTINVSPNGLGCGEHPRVCGENMRLACEVCEARGTSPRMRGKPLAKIPFLTASGNIPAYAGKTKQVRRGHHPVKEHPRVCGENHQAIWLLGAPEGTSPRMRGKPATGRLAHSLGRNIPAYAGKT